MHLDMTDKINIYSSRYKDDDGNEMFYNNFQKNLTENFFNLTIYNFTESVYRKIRSENRLSYNNFNISIKPELQISFYMNNYEKIKNVSKTNFYILNLDNIIDVNNAKFFKNYSEYNSLKLDENLNIKQLIKLNYGVVKLKDDYGIIFSNKYEKISLKKLR